MVITTKEKPLLYAILIISIVAVVGLLTNNPFFSDTSTLLGLWIVQLVLALLLAKK